MYTTGGGNGTVPYLIWRLNAAANNDNNCVLIFLHNDNTSPIQIAIRHGILAGPSLPCSNFLCRLLFHNESRASKEFLDTILHIFICTSNSGTICVLYISLEVIQPPPLVIALHIIAFLVLTCVRTSAICHSSRPQGYVQVR